MSSKIRMVLKVYDGKRRGYEAYRGRDALRLIEMRIGQKPLIKLPFLQSAYRLFVKLTSNESFASELYVWRVRKGARSVDYAAAIRGAQQIMVWDAGTKSYLGKHPSFLVKSAPGKVKLKKVVNAKFRWPWEVDDAQWRVERGLEAIEFIPAPEDIEPRDR